MGLTSDPISLSFGIFYIICGFVTIFGNSINIVCYFKNAKKIGNITNRFIVIMAICDFTFGFTAIFCSLFYLIAGFEKIIGNALCNLELILYAVPLSTDIMLMSLTGFNRYIYVAHKVSISLFLMNQ